MGSGQQSQGNDEQDTSNCKDVEEERMDLIFLPWSVDETVRGVESSTCTGVNREEAERNLQ